MVLLNKRRSPLEESIWKAKSCLLLDIFCHVYVVVNPFFSKISCQINTLSMWVTVRWNQGCAWRMMCTHMKEGLQRLTYNTTVECKPCFFFFFFANADQSSTNSHSQLLHHAELIQALMWIWASICRPCICHTHPCINSRAYMPLLFWTICIKTLKNLLTQNAL